MKATQTLINCLFLLTICRTWGQGTFIYDQQSATDTTPAEGGLTSMTPYQPIGQSFTPALTSVGFVQFNFFDSSSLHNRSAVIDVALHSTSITGPILGTSDPIALPAGFTGSSNFYFSTPVAVTSGTTYYLQLVLLSGDTGISGEFVSNYPGGTEILQGTPQSGSDLWFREGVVVPEPSTWALLVLGGGVLLVHRRRR